jgi:trimethylamine--corrinoid protein Co-methyltransferase
LPEPSLEGGPTFGYENFIVDIEALQTLAELCRPAGPDTAALACDAIAEVDPGGHFFAAQHTIKRYQTAFYAPLVADLSNHGRCTGTGELCADQRASPIWQRSLAHFTTPAACVGAAEPLAPYIGKQIEKGGMPPED